MRNTPVLSDLELALLGLIRQEARSGYALRKAFDSVFLGGLSDSPGAIYPALRRLRSAGLIDAPSAHSARKTEVFRITTAGRRALRAALEMPVSPSESHERLLLRFAFMDLELDAAAIAAFLRSYGTLAAQRAERLRTRRSAVGLGMAALALEHEIDVSVTRAKWAERAVTEITRLWPATRRP
jgi:DNA-binding PadR family transcriptional regulator